MTVVPIVHRVQVHVNTPGPGAMKLAADRLRASVRALDILIAEPIATTLSAVNEDGVESDTARWAEARALMVIAP